MVMNNRIKWSFLQNNDQQPLDDCENSAVFKELQLMSQEMLEELEYLYECKELLYGTVTLYKTNGELSNEWIEMLEEYFDA
jgi:hypothetical protein